MKLIELTQEHKFKLLKMCKELFSEYVNYKWDVIHCTDDIKYNGILFMYKKNGDNDEFHWFEFCTITLWNELYLKLGHLELKSYYELLLNNLIHPVDYLYEEFKKLK